MTQNIATAAEAEAARQALEQEAARLEAIPASTVVEEAAQAILEATKARDAIALAVELGEVSPEALPTAEKALDDARLHYVTVSGKADLGRAARVRLDAVEVRLSEARKGSALATIEALVGLQGESAVRYRRAASTLRAEALRMRALSSLVRGQEAAAGLRFGKTPEPLDLAGAHLPATRWCGAPRGENFLLLRDTEVQALREEIKSELAASGLPV
ncbi:MAG: hypothetical protein RL434_1032 [Pseudomonadota bacterium]|jgi:hypothetical protein